MNFRGPTHVSAAVLLACALAGGQVAGQVKKSHSKSPASVDAPAPSSGADAQSGLAVIYHDELNGRRTASGELYKPGALTAAHRTYPFGTKIRVTHVKNNRSVIVRVNDRGPTQASRVVDLSRAAGDQLRMLREGTAEVKIELVEQPRGK